MALYTSQIAVYPANVNTDDVVEAEFMKLSAKDPEGLRQLGLKCLERKPTIEGVPFMKKSATKRDYGIIIAGPNFGCGSSREQAPYALAESGVYVIVAPSFAPIFWRNTFESGIHLKLRTSENDLTSRLKTGQTGTFDYDENKILVGGFSIALLPLSNLDKTLEREEGLLNYAEKHFSF